MRIPTSSSLVVSVLALALAAPLLSCAAEVIDEVPAPEVLGRDERERPRGHDAQRGRGRHWLRR